MVLMGERGGECSAMLPATSALRSMNTTNTPASVPGGGGNHEGGGGGDRVGPGGGGGRGWGGGEGWVSR